MNYQRLLTVIEFLLNGTLPECSPIVSLGFPYMSMGRDSPFVQCGDASKLLDSSETPPVAI